MALDISEQSMIKLSEMVATAVIGALEKKNIIGNNSTVVNNVHGKTDKSVKSVKSAYQKTEQLLYNYVGFKRIVEERMKEIDEIRRYGVPQKCGAVGERVQNGNLPQGIMLPEETVENAVRTVQDSVQGTVQVISLIDKCMAALKTDPYYSILEMRYFEGRTQEDIAVELNCTQPNVSYHRSRLVRELSMRLFPDQVIQEYMN